MTASKREQFLKFKREMKESNNYLKISELKDRYSYKIYAENACVGIWIGEYNAFMISYGMHLYASYEYHWDIAYGDTELYGPAGTVKPIELIEKCPLDLQEVYDRTIDRNIYRVYLCLLEDHHPIIEGYHSRDERTLIKQEVRDFWGEVKKSNGYLKMDELEDNHSYKINSGRAGVGVWMARHKAFLVPRYKVGPYPFLCTIDCADISENGATPAIELIEKCPFTIQEDYRAHADDSQEGQVLLKYLDDLEECNPIVYGYHSRQDTKILAINYAHHLSGTGAHSGKKQYAQKKAEELKEQLPAIALNSMRILEQAGYTYLRRSGKYGEDRKEHAERRQVDFHVELDAAVEQTCLYRPLELAQFLAENPPQAPAAFNKLKIELDHLSTQRSARNLVKDDDLKDLVVLNFASARKLGIGFFNGKEGQQSDLCRSSGLYPCLMTQPAYFLANRECPSGLYTDHMIYSPNVPWFRSRSLLETDELFLASVISAPAPSVGLVLDSELGTTEQIEQVLRHRAGLILALAAHRGHRNLLLGAWGCGTFKNQPSMVADAFGQWLESDRFQGCFDRVVFSIPIDPYSEKRELQEAIFDVFHKRFKL